MVVRKTTNGKIETDYWFDDQEAPSHPDDNTPLTTKN